MRHIKLTIQYDGTNYSGWQVQKRGATIQGLLEDALFAVTGEETRVTGASRTDAGVHAFEQVAVFKTDARLEPAAFVRAFNANLPGDIRIIDATEVSGSFHPRYDARNKSYAYLISRSREYSVFLKRYSWQVPFGLDCAAMQEAADQLVGTHDFSSFRASGCSARHARREVKTIEIKESDAFGFLSFMLKVPLITVRIRANAFLRHMVRNIAGTLVDVGRGKIHPEKIRNILESGDRSTAGKTAPACGLFLEKIEY